MECRVPRRMCVSFLLILTITEMSLGEHGKLCPPRGRECNGENEVCRDVCATCDSGDCELVKPERRCVDNGEGTCHKQCRLLCLCKPGFTFDDNKETCVKSMEKNMVISIVCSVVAFTVAIAIVYFCHQTKLYKKCCWEQHEDEMNITELACTPYPYNMPEEDTYDEIPDDAHGQVGSRRDRYSLDPTTRRTQGQDNLAVAFEPPPIRGSSEGEKREANG